MWDSIGAPGRASAVAAAKESVPATDSAAVGARAWGVAPAAGRWAGKLAPSRAARPPGQWATVRWRSGLGAAAETGSLPQPSIYLSLEEFFSNWWYFWWYGPSGGASWTGVEPDFVFRIWSRRPDSNRRPAVYKTAALPLSYVGVGAIIGRTTNLPTGAREIPIAECDASAAEASAGAVVGRVRARPRRGSRDRGRVLARLLPHLLGACLVSPDGFVPQPHGFNALWRARRRQLNALL